MFSIIVWRLIWKERVGPKLFLLALMCDLAVVFMCELAVLSLVFLFLRYR